MDPFKFYHDGVFDTKLKPSDREIKHKYRCGVFNKKNRRCRSLSPTSVREVFLSQSYSEGKISISFDESAACNSLSDSSLLTRYSLTSLCCINPSIDGFGTQADIMESYLLPKEHLETSKSYSLFENTFGNRVSGKLVATDVSQVKNSDKKNQSDLYKLKDFVKSTRSKYSFFDSKDNLTKELISSNKLSITSIDYSCLKETVPSLNENCSDLHLQPLTNANELAVSNGSEIIQNFSDETVYVTAPHSFVASEENLFIFMNEELSQNYNINEDSARKDYTIKEHSFCDFFLNNHSLESAVKKALHSNIIPKFKINWLCLPCHKSSYVTKKNCNKKMYRSTSFESFFKSTKSCGSIISEMNDLRWYSCSTLYSYSVKANQHFHANESVKCNGFGCSSLNDRFTEKQAQLPKMRRTIEVPTITSENFCSETENCEG